MSETLILHGYRYSVYTRIVRIVLHEKGLAHTYREVDPFSETPDPDLLPFGRVPALTHGPTTLYETVAITRYLDAAFAHPALTPCTALAQARMVQVMSVIDNYAYWPLVRQVFSHRVFRPLEGGTGDEAEIVRGLKAAHPVLAALDGIAAEALVLAPTGMTLADAHLAPMIDYFSRAPDGAMALSDHSNLAAWWARIKRRASIRATDPDLASLA